MLRALIVDDESLARRRLRRLLTAAGDVTVVAECNNGRDAIEALRTHQLDVVFLDVQMPGTDGFGVVKAVGAGRMPAVVFVTAFDRYALRAFDVHAVDYLVKPIAADRLTETLERLRVASDDRASAEAGRRLSAILSNLGAPAPSSNADAAGEIQNDRVCVKQGDRLIFVRLADVDWFEADGNYVQLHAGDVIHTVRQTMNELETALGPRRFARIHRSVIVNLDRVREIEPWFAGDQIVVLTSGHRLKMSRTYREQVLARLHVL